MQLHCLVEELDSDYPTGGNVESKSTFEVLMFLKLNTRL